MYKSVEKQINMTRPVGTEHQPPLSSEVSPMPPKQQKLMHHSMKPEKNTIEVIAGAILTLAPPRNTVAPCLGNSICFEKW